MDGNLLDVQYPPPNLKARPYLRYFLVFLSFATGIFAAVVIGWMSFRTVPTMSRAEMVMDKSEVLFNLLWQTFCNESSLLPPQDCAVLHP